MMTNTSPQKLLSEKKPDGLCKVPTGDIAKTPLHPGLFVEHSTSRRLGDDVAMALAHVTGGGLLKRMNVTRRFACWHQTPHLTGPAIALWPPSLLVLPQRGPGPGEELMSWRTSAVANSRASASSRSAVRSASWRRSRSLMSLEGWPSRQPSGSCATSSGRGRWTLQ